MPDVIVIAGPNGAGKSTLAPALLRDTLGIFEYVNADTIAEGMSAFAPENAAFDAGRIMLGRLRELAIQGHDFAFETTLASRHYAKWLKELKTRNYRSVLIFLWLESVELAIERVRERVRVGGHSIPEETIRRRFDRGLKNLFSLYLPVVDEWKLYDASGPFPLEIIRRNPEEGEIISNEKLWKKIRA
jgi:predicted ABC-type ATPase